MIMTSKRLPKVYMGPRSVAKIPVRGKVDTAKEILLNAFATAWDIRDKKLLTHYPKRVIQAKIQTVNGRFLVLRRLAKNSSARVYNTIRVLHELAVAYLNGKLSRAAYEKALTKLARERIGIANLNLIKKRVR